jgi:hypothetical protein
MFKIELDLVVYFPPMEEHGQGVRFTRGIELPFIPSAEIAVHSMKMEECPEPLGIALRDLIWDMDRQVFLATTKLIDNVPMAMIPRSICGLIDRGWRLGSWMDTYREDEPVETKVAQPVSLEDIDDWDEDEAEEWPGKRPSNRPASFNTIFGAMIRTMAELHNNSSVAYAMDKTKRFLHEDQLKQDFTFRQRWGNLCWEFARMSMDQQIRWCDRMIRKYPSLAQLVADR